MAAPMAAADTAAPPPPPPPAAEPTPQIPPASSDMAPPTAAAAPPPPAPAPPTAAPDVAAPPPPPQATEPAVHMSAPTAPAARPPPPLPPAPELAARVFHAPPPFPPQPDAPAPKKRKLEEAGFHTSSYYKIRATVADLRLRFIQVYETADFRKSDAAREILRELKTVMELSKKLRLDLSAFSEPVKPLEKPLAGAVKDGPTEPIPSGERSQVRQVRLQFLLIMQMMVYRPPKPNEW